MLKARMVSLWAAMALSSIVADSRAQFRAAGYIDPSFAAPCLSNAAVNFSARALAVQTDGRILAAGNFNSVQSCVNGIARLRTNGALDTTFISQFLPGDFVNAMILQPDGKAIVGGLMRDSSSIFAVARLNLNGSIDGSFVRALIGSTIVINAFAVQPDGRIIAVGYDLGVPGSVRGAAMRLNSNGGVDGNFKQGRTQNSANQQGISAVAVQGANIILGGSFPTYFDTVNTVTRDGIVRVDSTGSIDATFNPFISNTDIRALLVQPDGKILVAGNFTANGLGDRCLTRLNSDGTADLTFASLDAHGTIGLSLALQPDGKILLGHSFGLVRITTNGAIDTTFGPLNAFSQLGTEADSVTSLSVLGDKRILAGAFRVGVSGTERRSVARLFGDIAPAPVIVQQPATQLVDSGTNVTFSVIATGAPPLFYQWRKDGKKISGAIGDTLVLTNVHSTDTANYTVVVSNEGGSVTSQVARLIVSFNTSLLTIITNGVGAVLPDLTKKPLEIGQTYTITARPAVGNLFSNWASLDPAVTIPSPPSPSLTFVMQSNLTLVVDFVPNPFTLVRGTFNGLFFNTNALSHSTAGGVVMKLDDKGRIRGTLRMGQRARKFSSVFSLQQTASVSLPATTKDPALTLSLALNIPNAAISGSVLFGTNTAPGTASEVAAFRNPFSSRANPATNNGAYKVALVGALPSEAVPAGDGFASFTVSTAGKVSAKGALADGSAIKVGTGQGAEAQFPVYVSLYGGRGSLFGWITATSAGLESAGSTLWWIKPAGIGGSFYPAGFTNVLLVTGSQFIKVPAHTPVITLTNGMVFLEGGNLAMPFTNAIALGADNKIVGDNQLTLTISPAKGTVTGSFVDPSINKKRSVKGIALQAQNAVRGFFLGESGSGRVFAGDTPAGE